MINKIVLENFQSHENTELNFCKGINSIIGSSDSGKSAILRAIFWTIYNRPVGNSFVSSWILNDKEIIKTDQVTRVRIENEKGFVQREKSRLKIDGKINDFNGYSINGNIAEAIRTEVPEEVIKFFNFSEVNIQKQLDSPFLLSETPGEIARFFNRIIKLDEIDKSLSLIDKKKRDNKLELDRTKKNIVELENNLLKYEWIEKVESLVDKLDIILEKIQNKENQVLELNKSLSDYNFQSKKLKELNNFINIEPIILEVNALDKEWREKQKEYYTINISLKDYEELQESVNNLNRILFIDKDIKESIELCKKIEKLEKDCNNIKKSLNNFNNLYENIKKLDIKIEEINKTIPDVCPICNGTGRLK